MAWSGFSEAQIKQMKGDTTRGGGTSSRSSRGGRCVNRRGRPPVDRSRGPPPALRGEEPETTLPAEQRLAPPRQHGGRTSRDHPQPTVDVKGSTRESETGPKPLEEDKPDERPAEKKEPVVNIIDDSEGQQRELTKLQQLQEQQKRMEAENKKKKALLFQALENRKKRTQEEAKRLAFVQKELTKIESLLTSDVSILRDKIEEASRLYADAERRYQGAEKEFVAAKLNLHKMEEKKEALTEHLFTIIHQNEQRKAKKLEELVTSLDTDDMDLLSDNLPGAHRASIGVPGGNPGKSSGGNPGNPSGGTQKLETNRDDQNEVVGKTVSTESEVSAVGERSPADGASPSEMLSEEAEEEMDAPASGKETVPSNLNTKLTEDGQKNERNLGDIPTGQS